MAVGITLTDSCAGSGARVLLKTGLKVEGVGLRVGGLGLRTEGLKFRVEDLPSISCGQNLAMIMGTSPFASYVACPNPKQAHEFEAIPNPGDLLQLVRS